ncbi:hypothetical protein ACSSS7_003672 [Eimeria intestinalis]
MTQHCFRCERHRFDDVLVADKLANGRGEIRPPDANPEQRNVENPIETSHAHKAFHVIQGRSNTGNRKGGSDLPLVISSRGEELRGSEPFFGHANAANPRARSSIRARPAACCI